MEIDQDPTALSFEERLALRDKVRDLPPQERIEFYLKYGSEWSRGLPVPEGTTVQTPYPLVMGNLFPEDLDPAAILHKPGDPWLADKEDGHKEPEPNRTVDRAD